MKITKKIFGNYYTFEDDEIENISIHSLYDCWIEYKYSMIIGTVIIVGVVLLSKFLGLFF